MATRFNADSAGGLASGYSGNPDADFTLPPCGIEDVDRALFEAFDKQIEFAVTGDGGTKRVPVIFAAGERWAVLKRGQPLRDKNNTLILPLITIMRTEITQDVESDVTGRGINQQTGAIVVRRRLGPDDRQYQNLLNRLLLQHQHSVAAASGSQDDGQLYTLRDVGELASADPEVAAGALLRPDLLRNVHEVVTVPSPQFFSAAYKVTFWTQYTHHMNQLVEKLVASYLPQGNALRVEVPGKGYWFVATVEGNAFSPESNFEDMSAESRVIKLSFSVSVPAYVLATDAPGASRPTRRYVSAASVTFQVPTEEIGGGEPVDPFLGADDPTLPLTVGPSRRRDQRDTRASRLTPPEDVSPSDPALLALPRGVAPAHYRRVGTRVDPRTGKLVPRYARSVVINAYTGETSYRSVTSLDDLAVSLTDE